MMSSVCFDIVVPPVFTCYVYKFYETKTNNYLKHVSHMQTEGLRIYNIFYTSTCIIQINFVLNLNRGQIVTSRELNLPFQMPSFLCHRAYASSLGYKYNELKCLILHNDEFGETWRHFLCRYVYTLSAIGRILGSWCRHSIGEMSIF